MGFVLTSGRRLQPHGPPVVLMMLGAIYYGALALSIHCNDIVEADGPGSTHEFSNLTKPPVKFYVHSDYFQPLPTKRIACSEEFLILIRNKRHGLSLVRKGCRSRHIRFLLLLLLLLGGDVETNPGPSTSPAVSASQPLPTRRAAGGRVGGSPSSRLSLPGQGSVRSCGGGPKCLHASNNLAQQDFTLSCCMCEKIFHCDCGFAVPSVAKDFEAVHKIQKKLKLPLCCKFCVNSRKRADVAARAGAGVDGEVTAGVDTGSQTEPEIEASVPAAALAQPSTSAADQPADVGQPAAAAPTTSDNESQTEKFLFRKITAFHGYRMSLSNFFSVPVKFGNDQGKSVEHLYQAAKARHHGQPKLALEILAAPRAATAKSLAKQLPDSEEWKNRRAALMCNLIRAKFESAAAVDFRRDLYRSGPNGIIAHSTPYPGSDKYWSTDMSMEETVRCASGVFRGRNLLGVQLTALRDEKWPDLVREFGPAEPEDVPPTQLLPAAPSTSNDSCRYCGVPGHSVAQCRYDRPLVCDACHRRGHKKRYCKSEETGQANTPGSDRQNSRNGPLPRLIDIPTSPPWPPRGFCPPVRHPYFMPPGFFRNLGFGPYMPFHPHPNVHAMRANAFGARTNAYGVAGNHAMCVNGMATRPGRRGDQAPAAAGRVATG
jgi:ribA/ribD-fused uncharacterized protein